MNLMNLPDDAKYEICKYLSILDYNSLKTTCKGIFDSQIDKVFWKRIYHECYSSQSPGIDDPKQLKTRIKAIETELKSTKPFSKQFRICMDKGYDKLGSLRKIIHEKNPQVLTTCLRDLAGRGLDKNIQLNLARILLKHGANPLQAINTYLDDFPLKVALIKKNQKLVALFLGSIKDKPDTYEKVTKFLKKLQKNPIGNIDTTLLEKFVQNNRHLA